MRMNMSTRVDSTTLAPLFRHKKLNITKHMRMKMSTPMDLSTPAPLLCQKKLRKMSTPVDSTTPAPLLCRKKLFLMMINCLVSYVNCFLEIKN
nr:hypothetical protein Iba_chr10dCG8250 [Ipomoea batatas]